MEDTNALSNLYWNEAMVYEAEGDDIQAYEKIKGYGEQFSYEEDAKKEMIFLIVKTR